MRKIKFTEKDLSYEEGKQDGCTACATGLNHEVYENFIKQIGKEKLIVHADVGDVGSAVERTRQIEKLEAEAAKLEKKQYTEVQPKRKYEIHERVLKIKEQLEELRNGKAEDAHK